ncbi:MAG: LpxD N-terminal domain-containing protein, partial [Candidatus Acidiferrales bacterium]
MAHTAGELAKFLEAKIHGDAQARITGLANPESAGAEDLIYMDAPKHADRAARSASRCVIVPADTTLAEKTLLEVANPKLAFAKAAAWLLPKPALRPEIHPTAIVANTARLAANIRVGPYVVIEDEVEIGSGTAVDAFCFLGRGAHVGQNCWLHPRVTLYAGAQLKD